MNPKINIKQYIKIVVITSAAVIAILNFSELLNFISTLFGIITPLLLGAAIAFLVNIVMTKFEKIIFTKTNKPILIKCRKPLCVFLSYLIIIAIVIIIMMLIVPELIQAITAVSKAIPVLFSSFQKWIAEHSDIFPSISDYLQSINIDWGNVFKTIAGFAGNGIGDFVNTTISVITVITSGVLNFVIALVFSVSLLFYKEKLIKNTHKFFKAYISQKWQKRLLTFGRTANSTFASFITGQCMESVILGVLCLIGMLIFQFPYAGMIATLVGATCLIPYFGAYIGSILGAFIILTVNPLQAFAFLAFIIVLQQFEGNVIYPRVVGSSIGLPGLWVMAAVTIGGGLAGIMGMLIGVPAAATIYKLTVSDINRRCETS